MTREHASKGFKVVAGTSATPVNFYGFNVTSEAVVATIEPPTQRAQENTAYSCDAAGLASLSFLPPGYYPIRGSSITLVSGEIILWIE